jgi:hypothetical protein
MEASVFSVWLPSLDSVGPTLLVHKFHRICRVILRCRIGFVWSYGLRQDIVVTMVVLLEAKEQEQAGRLSCPFPRFPHHIGVTCRLYS